MIEFLGKKNEFLAHGNQRGYKNLLVCEGKIVDVDKLPIETEFEMAEHGSSV